MVEQISNCETNKITVLKTNQLTHVHTLYIYVYIDTINNHFFMWVSIAVSVQFVILQSPNQGHDDDIRGQTFRAVVGTEFSSSPKLIINIHKESFRIHVSSVTSKEGRTTKGKYK